MEIKDIIKFSKLLYKRNYVTGTQGNLSFKKNDRIYLTSSGISKRNVKKKDICILDIKGDIKKGENPSSERSMHVCIYESEPGINCIIHSHPPYCVMYSAKHDSFNMSGLKEFSDMEEIRIIPFRTPGSLELAYAVKDEIKGKRGALILKDHGLIAFAEDLEQAFNITEMIEYYSRTLLHFVFF